ncbi:MAG: FTR1 family protein [Methylococcales bacterium]|nr:FTR1 family protein [Methylococcales bacterium]
MDTFLPATIMAFREGLEGFLIVTLLLKFLTETNNQPLKKQVWLGVLGGILTSLLFGGILMGISSYIGGLKTTAKLWESVAGLIAVIFVTTFVVWMINHGSQIKAHIEQSVQQKMTPIGVMLLTLFMIAREGTEIAIFSFAGKYSLLPIVVGLSLSIALVILINYSLIRVNLKTIFILTLGYLIIQAGYLFGYSLHEGLSAAKSLNWLASDHFVFNKAFNLSKTLLNHKTGWLGMPLNVTLGWYSKPEWIQLVLQYSYTFLLFNYWFKRQSSS